MDPISESYLAHVHPDLVKVLRFASQKPQAWRVSYGLRTLQAEAKAVATGHSETMHSRHLPDAHYGNVAMAVDVIALNNEAKGGIYATDHEQEVFGQISEQIMYAANTLGVKVQWGGAEIGAWVDGRTSTFHDWGHFQLDPSSYV